MNSKEPVMDNDNKIFFRPYSGNGDGAAGRPAKKSVNEAIVEAISLSMRGGDGRTRCYAVKALGDMEIKEAVEPLVRYLEDPDPDVRCDSAAALGRIKDKRAVKPLIKSLEDTDGQVRICAIEALAAIGDAGCVDKMISTMSSEENFSYSIGSDLSGDYLWTIKERVAWALGEIGDRMAVGALMEILKDEDAEFMVGTVLRSLAQLGGEDGLAAVSSYLNKPNAALRRKAAKAFIYSKDPGALGYLTGALLDSDPVVKANAMEAVGWLGGGKDIVPLVLLLNDKDSDIRVKAAEVIGKICGPKALAYIRPLLDDPDMHVRRKAVEVLGSRCAGDSFEQIAGVLKDSDEDEAVLGEAVLALTNTGGRQTVGPLAEVLNNKKIGKGLRSKALVGLGKVKTEEGLSAVIGVLRDKDEDKGIRLMALEVLRLFDKTILSRVEDLAGCDEFVKKGVSRILRDFSDPASEDMLVTLLKNDENDAVKKEAALSLACRGNDAGLDLLISMMKSEGDDPFEFFSAIMNIKNERAQNLLMDGLKGENASFRRGAAKAAGQSGRKDYAILLVDLLDDSETEVRREAVIALGSLEDKSALEPLVASLFDFERFYNLRRDIALSIKKIDAEGAVEMLLDILSEHGKKNCHWIAIESLSTLHGIL